jgi:hypothetical protein
VQLQQPEADLRMVRQVAFGAQHAVAPGVAQAAVALHDAEQELRQRRGRGDEIVAAQQPPGLGQRPQRHAVPVGEHLIKLIDTVDLEGGPGTSFCSL